MFVLLAMLVASIIILVWRIADPEIMSKLDGIGLIYLLLVVSLSVLVMIIGWNGAAMTFPVEKE